MKTYEFNKDGKCTNPDIFGKGDGENSSHIRSWSKNGFWFSSFCCEFDSNLSGCLGNTGRAHPTQHMAVMEAIRKMLKLAAEQDDPTNPRRRFNITDGKPETTTSIHRCCEMAFEQASQTTLFEL